MVDMAFGVERLMYRGGCRRIVEVLLAQGLDY